VPEAFGHFESPEDSDRPPLEAVTRVLVKTVDWEDLYVQIHELLLLLVITNCKCPMNAVMYSHLCTWQQ
jgi:hypothetical protein